MASQENSIQNTNEDQMDDISQQSPARWVILHNLNKLTKEKLTQERKRLAEENDKQYLMECTFTPKTNRLPSYLTKRDNEPETVYNTISNTTHLDRQMIWLQKTKEKREAILQKTLADKDDSQWTFKPQFNSHKAYESVNFNEKTADIIEDPESFNNFIKRNEKARKEKDVKGKKSNGVAGSGRLWKRKPLKVNDYDYKKHQLSPMKTMNKKGMHYMKTLPNKNYCVYTENNKTESNNIDSDDNSRIIVTNPKNYGEGLNELHRKLMSIKLINE